MATIKKVERISITDQIVKQLQELIETNQYNVGEKLPSENELSSQFGVGRSTVREALRVLAATGNAEIRPGRGAFVASRVTNSMVVVKDWFAEKHVELGDLIELRMAIESVSIRFAIKRAMEKDIQAISEIHQAFQVASLNEDTIALASLDSSFHSAIIQASNNKLLIKIGKLVSEQMVGFRIHSYAVTENIGHSLKDHQEIMEALINREEEYGVKAMLHHLESTRNDMEQVVLHTRPMK